MRCRQSRLPSGRQGWTAPLAAEPACALLAHRERVPDNPFVFAGRGEEGHLVNVRKPWVRISRRRPASRASGFTICGTRSRLTLLEKTLKLRSWRSFVDTAPRLFDDIVSATRLTIPRGVNRSRWADDALWREVREAVAQVTIVSGMEPMPTAKLAELANERRNLLYSQFVGLAKSLAVADGVSFTNYPSYLESLFMLLLDETRSKERRVVEEFGRKAAELSIRFAQGWPCAVGRNDEGADRSPPLSRGVIPLLTEGPRRVFD